MRTILNINELYGFMRRFIGLVCKTNFHTHVYINIDKEFMKQRIIYVYKIFFIYTYLTISSGKYLKGASYYFVYNIFS